MRWLNETEKLGMPGAALVVAAARKPFREMENYPEGEIAEMVQIYCKRGFSEADAKFIIDILSKNKVNST